MKVVSCLEALLVHLQSTFLLVDKIVLISDNATVFTGTEWIPWIIKFSRKYPSLRVSRYMNTEAQTGRDMLDTHFSFLNKKIDAFVRKGNAVQTPDELFAALTDDDGVANTSTLLLEIDADKAQLFNSNKKMFKVKSGVRKIHDIVYDDACVAVGVGRTPMCRIFTNSGVPNSVVAGLRTSSKIFRYLCALRRLQSRLLELSSRELSHRVHMRMYWVVSCVHGATFVVLVVIIWFIVDEVLTGVSVVNIFSSTKEIPLCKSLDQALSTEDIISPNPPPVTRDETELRCSRCSRLYATAAARVAHEENCTAQVIRDKDELIARALQEFFTLSKQTFADTRSRLVEVAADPVDVALRRSNINWAEKESINSHATLPPRLRAEIQRFFSQENSSGRKIKPHDVAGHLLQSIVSPTDWEAKFLLSEQRLKTELSRLSKLPPTARI
jgi:hypothetical protein